MFHVKHLLAVVGISGCAMTAEANIAELTVCIDNDCEYYENVPFRAGGERNNKNLLPPDAVETGKYTEPPTEFNDTVGRVMDSIGGRVGAGASVRVTIETEKSAGVEKSKIDIEVKLGAGSAAEGATN